MSRGPSFQISDQMVIYALSDANAAHGIGIEEEFAMHLFEDYYYP